MSAIPTTSTLRRVTHQRRLVAGAIITSLVVLLAVVGPWIAPYGEHEIVGAG